MNKVWNKKENQILIMLAFFSISIGLWGILDNYGYKIMDLVYHK